MLQIYIFGTNESGFLDVDPGTVLTIEKTTNEFDEDFAVGEISLPADFPWTENNRRLLNFSERVSNNVASMPSWRCHAFDDGFPEMVNAKFTILTKQGNWDYSSGKFSASISGEQGLFGTAIRNRKLRELRLGGLITWENMSSREFATGLMKGTVGSQFPYIKFAPITIQNYYDTGAKTYDGEFLAGDTVNIMVENGAAWSFDRQDPDHPDTAVLQDVPEYNDYQTVPFFSVQYILKQIFIENGFNVSGDIFSPDFKNLMLFNNYGLDRYYANNYRDFNRSINPSNHVPDVLVIDFLKSVFNFFNLYVTFTGLQSAEIKFRQKNITERKIFSIGGMLVNNSYQSTITDQDQDGYSLKYTWDNEDDYPSNWNKDISDKNLIATVNKLTDLTNINIGRNLTTTDIALVMQENLYYVVADGTSNPVKWEVYSDHLPDYISSKGDRNIDMSASTLCQYILQDPDNGLNVRKPWLACSQKGSFTNKGGTRIINNFGVRFFYISYQPDANGHYRPRSYYHRTSADFTLTEHYSLAMGVNYGLESLHVQWQNFLNGKETFKTSIIVDKKSQAAIESCNQLELQNVLFVPSKITKKIPMDGIVEVEMKAI